MPAGKKRTRGQTAKRDATEAIASDKPHTGWLRVIPVGGHAWWEHANPDDDDGECFHCNDQARCACCYPPPPDIGEERRARLSELCGFWNNVLLRDRAEAIKACEAECASLDNQMLRYRGCQEQLRPVKKQHQQQKAGRPRKRV